MAIVRGLFKKLCVQNKKKKLKDLTHLTVMRVNGAYWTATSNMISCSLGLLNKLTITMYKIGEVKIQLPNRHTNMMRIYT